MQSQERYRMSFDTIKLETGRVLRDNPMLRTKDMREKVWLMIKTKIPTAKFSTVERSIRKLQNDYKMWLPDQDDGRYQTQEQYIDYFRGDSNGCRGDRT